MDNIILAIDLGKYKSVACLLDESSGEYRFTTFDTSRAEMEKIIGKERPGVVVVIEACLLAGCSRRLQRHLAGIELADLLGLPVARRGFWDADAPIPLEGKERKPSLVGNSRWPDPV